MECREGRVVSQLRVSPSQESQAHGGYWHEDRHEDRSTGRPQWPAGQDPAYYEDLHLLTAIGHREGGCRLFTEESLRRLAVHDAGDVPNSAFGQETFGGAQALGPARRRDGSGPAGSGTDRPAVHESAFHHDAEHIPILGGPDVRHGAILDQHAGRFFRHHPSPNCIPLLTLVAGENNRLIAEQLGIGEGTARSQAALIWLTSGMHGNS